MYPEDFYEPPQFLSLIQVKEFASRFVPGSVMELRAKHRLLKYTRIDNGGKIIFYYSNKLSRLIGSYSININLLDCHSCITCLLKIFTFRITTFVLKHFIFNPLTNKAVLGF